MKLEAHPESSPTAQRATMTLAQLLAHLPDAQLHVPADAATVRIQAVTHDSRAVEPGTLFVAVRGETLDGHRFLPDACARGAVAGLGTRSPAELQAEGVDLPADFPYVQVANSREALATCAAVLHDFPSRRLTVIGVTGTDGKTTTCTLLESILRAATREEGDPAGRVGVITTVAARIRGQESDTGLHVTTPDAPAVQHYLAQMVQAGCRYAVVESTSHGLDQGRVSAVDFDVAAVTNITHEHLDYHRTREAYVQAKARLFRFLYLSPPKPGVPRCAVLNADDPGSFAALQSVLAMEAERRGFTVPVRTYGLAGQGSGHPDVTAADLQVEPAQTRFQLHWWGGAFPVETRLIGEFNVYNILCAATVALALEVPVPAIQAGIAELSGVTGRMERIDRGQPFLAIVDFAHSPASLERALRVLRQLLEQRASGAPAGRLIAVFGSAGLRDREKRRLMGQVSGRLADFTVITAEDPRTEDLDAINRAIAEGVREYAPETAFAIVPDRAEAIQFAVDMARPGDIVAAFGKGHERSMCFGTTEYPWSDQEAMAAALERAMGRRPAG
ncbi:UDP-N-acetylmuramoyl-L-alanyl-D-glutamate--2,6-diaminopimelate ligase [Litorilinea aerophila]|nr:UDP-N-acetylmuramoyl-L-alanyl-D-glutamate--2,6-diaminopimelate ligase [Litorilinea aerophila]MCC9078334.1 UDP-N-acetylmuramoyl-L-alanyl-D-glutamate--2,6-diaminopimelate ligase [Litorilinea aerophila]GIV77122.1 MAG: UDP-N-acetylmuramyl-tripeptide synthetase [Litorilinea sp.]